MATIFQKTPTGQCLVLDAREGLTYPFNLGDWNEIRVGVELSMVTINSGNGFNTPYYTETASANAMTNSFFMGFRDTGSLFPNPVSGMYIGFVPRNNFPVNVTTSDVRISRTTNGNLPMGYISGGTSFVTTVDNDSRCVYIGSQAAVTGTTAYAARHGFQVTLVNKGTTGQQVQLNTFNNGASYVTPNPSGLRSFMSAMTNVISGSYFYLTAGGPSGGQGAALDFPNAFFLYNPFLGNMIRIHDIVIEKYG